ncbi:MAG: PEP-utilizing enzyme, partial [Planctomycetales bacterium]
FDLTNMQVSWYYAVGASPADANRALGGHQPEVSLPTDFWFRTRHAGKWGWATVGLLRCFWGFEERLGTAIEEILDRNLVAREQDDFRDSTKAELAQRLADNIALYADFTPMFGLSAPHCGFWSVMLEKQLEGASPQPQSLSAKLLAGTDLVTSAEQGYRVYEMAEIARTDQAARVWLTDPSRDPHGWKQLPKDSPFRQETQRFLDDFGHRGVYELEMANPRWHEDPSYVFDQVLAVLESNATGDPRDRARKVQAEANAELQRVPWWKRRLVRWLVKKARAGMGLREAAKSALVAYMETPRRIHLETARRIVAEGKLDSVEDVFYLTVPDIEAYLLEEWDGSGAREMADERRRQREAWLKETPPDVITLDGGGKRLETSSRPVASSRGSTDEWTGIGAAAGIATGTVRVLRHPSDGNRLLPGDVLAAPSTDPGWTPLFLRASAVVVETGGYLSHGAVVAREYGLPAVVNLPGLLDRIQDGDRLEVNGDRGTVRRLKD